MDEPFDVWRDRIYPDRSIVFDGDLATIDWNSQLALPPRMLFTVGDFLPQEDSGEGGDP